MAGGAELPDLPDEDNAVNCMFRNRRRAVRSLEQIRERKLAYGIDYQHVQTRKTRYRQHESRELTSG